MVEPPEGRAHDVAERPASLAGSEALLDAIPVALVLVAHDGTIAYANARLSELTGYRAEELSGRPVEVLVPEALRGRHVALRGAFERQRRARAMEDRGGLSCERADGSVFPADIALAPLVIAGRNYFVVTIRDETEQRRTEEALFHRAVHDPLTGLANRVLILDRLGHALARAARTEEPVAVLYIDLDRFKEVNDRWGHAAGDDVLRAVAARLAAAVRPSDSVSRYGGDEFVVLCEGTSGASDVAEMGGRLLQAIAPPITLPGGEVRMTASIGAAVVAGGRRTPASLIDAADQAMYRVKRAGGGAVAASVLLDDGE